MAVIEITATLEVTTPTFSAGIPSTGSGADVHYAVAVIDPATDLTSFTATDLLDAYTGEVIAADLPRSAMVGWTVAIVSGAGLGIYTVTASGACPPTSPQPEYGGFISAVLGDADSDPAALVAVGEDPAGAPSSYKPVRGEGGGGGGGAVDSVNGETGVVVLDAADVGADPAGTAAALVDDLSGVTNAATARSNLGLGTAATTAATDYATAAHNHSGVYQPADADLTAIAGLTSAADKLPYFTGAGTAALADLSSFGRSLIDDADAATARTTLGISADGDTTRRILIPTNQFDRSSVGITWNVDAGQSIGWGHLGASTGAVNDYIEWDVWFPAGTWTLLYYYLTGSSYGIATVSLDGTTLGATIDGYTAASVRNNVATRPGIVVATAGVKVLKVLMASKHASSSAYKPGTSLFDFRRTA